MFQLLVKMAAAFFVLFFEQHSGPHCILTGGTNVPRGTSGDRTGVGTPLMWVYCGHAAHL